MLRLSRAGNVYQYSLFPETEGLGGKVKVEVVSCSWQAVATLKKMKKNEKNKNMDRGKQTLSLQFKYSILILIVDIQVVS